LRITILGKTWCVLLHFDSSKLCVCPLYKFLYAFKVVKLFLKHPVYCVDKVYSFLMVHYMEHMVTTGLLTVKGKNYCCTVDFTSCPNVLRNDPCVSISDGKFLDCLTDNMFAGKTSLCGFH
jgi:hypothetical protein